jgi:hypothetical protein
MKLRQITLFVIKILITGWLLSYLIEKIDIQSVFLQLRLMQPSCALAALVALLAQLLLVVIRWCVVGQLIDVKLPFQQATRFMFIGQFFNQLLPSSIGGDAVRAWMASRNGISLARAAASIFCDRAVGLLVVVYLAWLSLMLFPTDWVPGVMTAGRYIHYFTAFATFGLLMLMLFGAKAAKLMMHSVFGRPFGVIVRDIRIVLFTNVKSLQIIGLSVGVQLLIALAAYFFARGINVNLRFIDALILIPLIMLISMLPVSLAGWGLRESAMVVGLGLVGIADVDALAISVAFGLAQIVIGIPGGALWLSRVR